MKTVKRLLALVVCLMFLLTPLAVTAEETPLLGDADGDGVITTTDARLTLSFNVCKCAPFPGEAGYGLQVAIDKEMYARIEEVCDVDGDEVITSTDARLILQYAVGKIAALPVD